MGFLNKLFGGKDSSVLPEGLEVEDSGIRPEHIEVDDSHIELGEFAGGVSALAATADGFLVAGEEDPEIRWIDATSGETRGSFTGHSAAIETLEVAHDAGVAASIEKESRTIKVWSLDSFAEVASFERPEEITAVALNSGGDLLGVGQEDGAVEILSVADGSAVHKLQMPTEALAEVLEEPPEKASRLALAPSGAHLGAIASGVLLSWALGSEDEVEIHLLSPHTFCDLEFRADGSYLAAACGSLRIKIRVSVGEEASVEISDVTGALWVKDTNSGETNHVSFESQHMDTVHWSQDGEDLIAVTSEPPSKHGLKKCSLVVSLQDIIGAGSRTAARKTELGAGAIGAAAAYAAQSSILAVSFDDKLYGWSTQV